MYIDLTTINLCPTSGGAKPETTFSVEPSTQAQAIIPEDGYVFSSGIVAAVDSTIDANITPGNIKSGISILGVQGTVNPQKPEEHLIETITTNGSHTYSPTQGSVFSDATISVAVPMKVEETFTVNPSTQAQTVLPESGHVFSSGVVAAVTSSIDSNIVPGNIKSGISILGVQGTVNPQKLEETFSITPRTTDLIVTPQEGYVFSSGVVAAVTSEIDANIVPENIRTGVSILGVTGNVSPAKSEDVFNVTPTTQAQTVTPQSGHVFSSGVVAAVTSSIDQNIVSSNIKDGVTILGVLGTYTGGVTPTGTISIPTNGTYDVTAYASAQVAVGGTDYRNQTGTIPGLADLGWDADSIGYANANISPHYSWQNSDYAVTQANKDLYGVVDKNNKNSYKTNTDMEYLPMFDTTGVRDMTNYFDGFSHIKGIPILDTSSVTKMESMFYGCTSLATIPLLDTGNVTNFGYMFRGCTSLKTVPALDTSSATFIDQMFYNCTSLTSIPLLDTSSVTSMGSMFYGCSSLTAIPLLDTGNVTDMSYMFYGCSSLTTIPALDTSSVTNMYQMFYSCRNLTTIPALDTSNVTDMYRMFNTCTSLTTVGALDTSKVRSMNQMFGNCSSLTTVNGIDFSSMTAAPSGFIAYDTVTRFIVNGKIDFTWNESYGLNRLTRIDFDSVKSILQAMSRTTNSNAKTMALNRTIEDNANGDLTALVADCQTKGWTITGLTIVATVIETGDDTVSNFGEYCYVGDEVTVNGIQMNELRLLSDDTLVGYNYFDDDDYYYDANGDEINIEDYMYSFDIYLEQNGLV